MNGRNPRLATARRMLILEMWGNCDGCARVFVGLLRVMFTEFSPPATERVNANRESSVQRGNVK
jgi:hypothetical protein